MRRCAIADLMRLRKAFAGYRIVSAAAQISVVCMVFTHRARLFAGLDVRLYGERLAGFREIPSRCALLRMAAGGRWSFKLITPVGVLPFASERNSRTSSVVHGSRDRRLYFGLALRGPFLPIGDPGRFQAACAMFRLPFTRLNEGISSFVPATAFSAGWLLGKSTVVHWQMDRGWSEAGTRPRWLHCPTNQSIDLVRPFG